MYSELSDDVPEGYTGQSVKFANGTGFSPLSMGFHVNYLNFPSVPATTYGRLRFWYKVNNANAFFDFGNQFSSWHDGGGGQARMAVYDATPRSLPNPAEIDATTWTFFDWPLRITPATLPSTARVTVQTSRWSSSGGGGFTFTGPYEFYIYSPEWYVDADLVSGTEGGTGGGTLMGTVPGCSRLGDIYEIVFASMERIEPASVAPATLEKDNHIIKYNQTDDLSKRTTVMTVRG
jgi:hypothetical protein